jgi:signal transduction histidine kinase
MAVRPSARRGSDAEYLRAIGAVAQDTLDGLEPAALFGRIVREARLLVGAQSAVIGTFDPDAGIVTIQGADGARADLLARGTELPLEQTLMQAVATTGKTVIFGEASPEPYASILARFGLGRVVCVPLMAGVRVLGGMSIGNGRGAAPFSRASIALTEAFAGQAAVALEFGRLEDELRALALVEERERIARDLHDGAIQALFGLGMELDHMAAHVSDPSAIARVAAAVGRIDEAMRILRTYIGRLQPDHL